MDIKVRLHRGVRSVRWVFVSKILCLFLGFASSILLSRTLSISDYGAYRFLFTAGTVLSYFISLGAESAIGRFVPEFDISENTKSSLKLVVILSGLRFVLLSLFLSIAYFFEDFIFQFFSIPLGVKAWYALGCLYIVFSQLHPLYGGAFFNARLNQGLTSSIELLGAVARLAIVAVVNWDQLDLLGLVSMTAAIEFIIFLIYLLRFSAEIFRSSRSIREILLARLDLKRTTNYCIFAYALSISGVFRELVIDNLVIARYLSFEAVAAYSFSASILAILTNLNPALFFKNVINFYFVNQYVSTNDRDSLNSGNQFVIKLSSFIMLPAFTCLAILLEPIIKIVYDPKFLIATSCIYWMLSLYVIQNCFIYGLSFVFSAIEALRTRVIGSVLIAGYNLIAELVLVQRFGIEGVAFATGSAAVLTVVYYVYTLRKVEKMNLQIPYTSLFKITCNLMVPSMILLMIGRGLTNLLQLLGAILIFIIFYLILSIKFRIFSPVERRLIKESLGRFEYLWHF